VKRQEVLEDESGFTLVELTMVIILMGVVFAIASSMWFGAVEARRVDSATNQLAADLRLAHTRAINRLADQTVILTAGNSEYTLPGGVTVDLDDDNSPGPSGDVVSVAAASTIVFKGNGSAQVTGAGLTAANPITVRGTTPPANGGRKHTIVINPVTSAIQIGP
jgi:prepilin-type N-terminal cleavage/methylation domain-containing protein